MISLESLPVPVFQNTPLDPPTVQAPLLEYQGLVRVTDVLPGAFVTLYLDGFPFAAAFSPGTEVEIPTLPLPVSVQIHAVQRLNKCEESPPSDTVWVGPAGLSQHLEQEPEIVEPIFACQKTFEVQNLIVGAHLEVRVKRANAPDTLKTVPIPSSEMFVTVHPALEASDVVEVQIVLCQDYGSEDSAKVEAKTVNPPVLVGPIFHGDPVVTVVGAPFGSLVHVYEVDPNPPHAIQKLVGVGMGGTPVPKIYLDTPGAVEQKHLAATTSFCDTSDLSNVVAVRFVRAPLPHDVMVTSYWVYASYAQSILFVSGRNIYKGSKIHLRRNGPSVLYDVYPTFPWSQLTPNFWHDVGTLETPIDTIGGVAMILYETPNNVRFRGDDVLEIKIENPNGSTGFLRHHRPGVQYFDNTYALVMAMNDLDSDGDGLTDQEEQPGAVVDLASMGASPYRQDVFLEIDYMQSGSHTHQPHSSSLFSVTNAFANAWVLNIDGSVGISLHVDVDDALPHYPHISIGDDQYGQLYQYFYDNDFDNHRKGLFHYCVAGHSQPGTSSGGLAEYFSDKLIITMGEPPPGVWPPWYVDAVAGMIIHELGHNIGLDHGGDVETNHKPNYVSVMNYRYPVTVSDDCDLSPEAGAYDYSYGYRASLDENSLNELEGICDHEPIDWNTNLSYEPSVSVDINFDGNIDPQTLIYTPNFSVLDDFCDWCYLTGDVK